MLTCIKQKLYYFEQVVLVQVNLGQRVHPNGNVVLSVLVQGLPVLLGEETDPVRDGHEPHLNENDSQVDLGHRAHLKEKVVLVQAVPDQVVLRDVPAQTGLPAHHKGNVSLAHADLAHLGEDVSHLVVDPGRPALRKEEAAQVLDKAHLVGADLGHGNPVVL